MHLPSLKHLTLLGLLTVGTVAYGGLFGESEAEKEARIATHVAELMRKPNELIAQAEAAADANNLDEAIRLFDQALMVFDEIEKSENTAGSAFSTFRIKKFHCISMLDALALQRNEVMDVRQAVTDTSDLESRLAQERAALLKEDESDALTTKLPTPPTWQEQFHAQEKVIAEAEKVCQTLNREYVELEKECDEQEKRFTKAARDHSAADAAVFMARTALKGTEALLSSDKPEDKQLYNEALATYQRTKDDLVEAKALLDQERSQTDALKAREEALEKKMATAQSAVTEARAGLDVIRKEIAKETAEAKRKAEEEKHRLEAETLLKQQAEAAARAQALAQKQAQEATQNMNSAEARAQATEEAKALTEELAWCEELWHLKKIDALEQRILEAAVRWTDEPAFMVYLARIRLVQGRLDDALEIAATIPPTGQTGIQARMVAAGVYLSKNKPLEAMKVLETTMQEHPTDPTPCFNMAIVLLRLPEVDPKRDIAAKYYERSIELGGKRSAVIERRLNME